MVACHYPVKTVVGGFHLLDDHETEQELTDMAHRIARVIMMARRGTVGENEYGADPVRIIG